MKHGFSLAAIKAKIADALEQANVPDWASLPDDVPPEPEMGPPNSLPPDMAGGPDDLPPEPDMGPPDGLPPVMTGMPDDVPPEFETPHPDVQELIAEMQGLIAGLPEDTGPPEHAGSQAPDLSVFPGEAIPILPDAIPEDIQANLDDDPEGQGRQDFLEGFL